MADKLEDLLLAALKQSLAEPGEQRLFKSGKLAGLFPSRNGAGGDAAAQALRDGLLEVVRTETRGKTTFEWVRPTPRGVAFLHDREAPVQVLRELHGLLQTNHAGVPGWLADIRKQIEDLGVRLTSEVQTWTNRLDALARRVEEALRRVQAAGPQPADGLADSLPWGLDALTYLFRRQAAGAAGDCPLPELFKALRPQHPGLTIKDFHDGLRRLQERGAIRLLPWTEPAGTLPEPEFALPDGEAVFYFANR